MFCCFSCMLRVIVVLNVLLSHESEVVMCSGGGFLLSFILSILPVPAAEMHTHSMTLLQPCFTVGMVLTRWCFLPDMMLAFLPKEFPSHQSKESFSTCCQSPLYNQYALYSTLASVLPQSSDLSSVTETVIPSACSPSLHWTFRSLLEWLEGSFLPPWPRPVSCFFFFLTVQC